jgi:hypothetical protein
MTLPEGLTELEYGILKKVVELVPEALPEEEGASAEEVAAHFVAGLDALPALRSPLGEHLQDQLSAQRLREYKVDMIFRRLHQGQLLDWRWGRGWGFAQPTIKGRAAVTRHERGWRAALWSSDFWLDALANALGNVIAVPVALALGVILGYLIAHL